jgi:hypothetical protein
MVAVPAIDGRPARSRSPFVDPNPSGGVIGGVASSFAAGPTTKALVVKVFAPAVAPPLACASSVPSIVTEQPSTAMLPPGAPLRALASIVPATCTAERDARTTSPAPEEPPLDLSVTPAAIVRSPTASTSMVPPPPSPPDASAFMSASIAMNAGVDLTSPASDSVPVPEVVITSSMRTDPSA